MTDEGAKLMRKIDGKARTSEYKEVFIDSQRVAELLSVKKKTIEAWRQKDIGPSYYKFSCGTIRYDIDEIMEWAKDRQVGSRRTPWAKDPLTDAAKTPSSPPPLTAPEDNHEPDFDDAFNDAARVFVRDDIPY